MNRHVKFSLSAGISFLVLNLVFINAGSIPEDKDRPTGLLPITAEEKAKLHKIKIKKVRMNELSRKRVNEERLKKGEALLPESAVSKEPEIESVESPGATIDSGTAAEVAGTAPAQVDNSALRSFPPIGSQGSLPSCTAWSVTYYQMSHEVCLTLGCDNKSLRQKVFSPRWTYSMINGGAAQGTSFSNAYSMQTNHGAALNAEFPYGSEYRSWDMNAEHWRTALNYKMSSMSSLAINSDSGMASLKQVLANGHVVVFSTYINSWQYRTVQQNPNATYSSFVGQQIVHLQNGTAGLHAMTIVGYDDSIWTDINGNGNVESAELGAFKIANSWGSSWRNAGYIWASYDAFRTTTAVPGFAPAGRNQLASTGSAYLTTYTAYQPKLLARVTLSHGLRNQMGLRFAQSSTSSQTPSTYSNPVALANKGGAFAFNGSTLEVEGTFYFDISSLAGTSIDQQIFYLLYSDNSAGSPLSVRRFEVLQPSNLTTPYAQATALPATADASSGQVKIGNYTGPVADTQAPSVPSSLTYQVTTSTTTKGKRTQTRKTVNLSWTASTDNVSVAKYRIFRNGVQIGETSNRTYSDSAATLGTTHIYAVQAVDAAGNVSAKVSVSVPL